MPFAEWAQRWEQTALDLRPTTLQLNLGVLRNYLLPRFGAWSIASIQTSDVQAMVAAELERGVLSSSAVRRHVLVLSPFMAAAVLDGRISRNPAKA